MPHHRILWAAAWLLNRCPPSWAPFAPRVVVAAAYRQLNRERLEGLALAEEGNQQLRHHLGDGGREPIEPPPPVRGKHLTGSIGSIVAAQGI